MNSKKLRFNTALLYESIFYGLASVISVIF